MSGSRPGSQLTALLAALGAGRHRLSVWPAAIDPRRAAPTAFARARSAGHDERTAARIATAIDALGAQERAEVMHPLTPADDGILRIAASVVRQSDETSCVATCLALIAAAGDVATALWLSTGADEAAVIDRYDLAAPLAGADAAVPAVRLRALEQSLKHSAVHRGRLRTWPRPFGTPPWGAARVAHFGRTRYGHRLVNDLDTDRAALALAGALSSIRRGFPVILYTGGDSTTGYRNAMPRHAVLLYRSEGAQTQELRIFEPGQGRVHEVSKTSLIRPGAVSAAYGGWPHLTWIVAPRPPG